jgi:hypothetical protein
LIVTDAADSRHDLAALLPRSVARRGSYGSFVTQITLIAAAAHLQPSWRGKETTHPLLLLTPTVQLVAATARARFESPVPSERPRPFPANDRECTRTRAVTRTERGLSASATTPHTPTPDPYLAFPTRGQTQRILRYCSCSESFRCSYRRTRGRDRDRSETEQRLWEKEQRVHPGDWDDCLVVRDVSSHGPPDHSHSQFPVVCLPHQIRSDLLAASSRRHGPVSPASRVMVLSLIPLPRASQCPFYRRLLTLSRQLPYGAGASARATRRDRDIPSFQEIPRAADSPLSLPTILRLRCRSHC